MLVPSIHRAGCPAQVAAATVETVTIQMVGDPVMPSAPLLAGPLENFLVQPDMLLPALTVRTLRRRGRAAHIVFLPTLVENEVPPPL
jgi:hypothetical protein